MYLNLQIKQCLCPIQSSGQSLTAPWGSCLFAKVQKHRKFLRPWFFYVLMHKDPQRSPEFRGHACPQMSIAEGREQSSTLGWVSGVGDRYLPPNVRAPSANALAASLYLCTFSTAPFSGKFAHSTRPKLQERSIPSMYCAWYFLLHSIHAYC